MSECASMEEFYTTIVNITKTSGYLNILTKDSQTVYDVIMKDYKNNIKIAASEGRTEAYLCIYEASAKIKGLISIDAYVRMNNPKVVEKFEEFKLEPVIERIKKKINPFKVEIRLLKLDGDQTTQDQNYSIVAVLAIWDNSG